MDQFQAGQVRLQQGGGHDGGPLTGKLPILAAAVG
jgi:hypothetical protein